MKIEKVDMGALVYSIVSSLVRDSLLIIHRSPLIYFNRSLFTFVLHLDFGPKFKNLDKIDSERPKDFWHAQKQIETNKDIKKIMKKVPKGNAAAMQRAAYVHNCHFNVLAHKSRDTEFYFPPSLPSFFLFPLFQTMPSRLVLHLLQLRALVQGD
jgi:hypothetical protein